MSRSVLGGGQANFFAAGQLKPQNKHLVSMDDSSSSHSSSSSEKKVEDILNEGDYILPFSALLETLFKLKEEELVMRSSKVELITTIVNAFLSSKDTMEVGKFSQYIIVEHFDSFKSGFKVVEELPLDGSFIFNMQEVGVMYSNFKTIWKSQGCIWLSAANGSMKNDAEYNPKSTQPAPVCLTNKE